MTHLFKVSISVVSHGQAALAAPLLAQLDTLAASYPLEIIYTENLAHVPPLQTEFRHAHVTYLQNAHPIGYGANHNAAFRHASGEYFCVLNPDVRLVGNPFEPLRAELERCRGVAGPRVLSPTGTIEDSARFVPTVARLLRRYTQRQFAPDYDAAVPVQSVDWLAGMCLMFDARTYAELSGFDECFHMYCEDVDICLRAHSLGRGVRWVQNAVIVHDAQRGSHRQFKPLFWHLRSMVQLVNSATYKSYQHHRPPPPTDRE